MFYLALTKEAPVVNESMDETVIVTYSPKYKAYQKKIHGQQVARAVKMLEQPGRKRRGKNQNDPARFIRSTAITEEGEVAGRKIYDLDLERISEEEQYDGFYAVITNLDGDASEILKINRQRWEIEENFRIMKTDFEARPVYVRREDRIRAHFLICYISLLVYRLLEKKTGNKYTCRESLDTLRSMQVTRLSKESGYIPSYKRTDLTDEPQIFPRRPASQVSDTWAKSAVQSQSPWRRGRILSAQNPSRQALVLCSFNSINHIFYPLLLPFHSYFSQSYYIPFLGHPLLLSFSQNLNTLQFVFQNNIYLYQLSHCPCLCILNNI